MEHGVLLAVLTCVVLACGTMVVYPYAIYPMVLRVLPSRPLASDHDQELAFSLLFCAYNEGKAIPEKLQNVADLMSRHPDLEVLAYDDLSSDDTLSLLRSRPDLIRVTEGTGRTGKAHGMKALAAKASGDILVFTDANVLLDLQALTHLERCFADPQVGGVCGSLRYLNAEDSPTASVGGTFWKLEERLKDLESRTGNVMGGDGSIFAVRRHLYPDFPDTVLDDLTVSMSVVFAGQRLVKARDVVAYERLVTDPADEFARKVRIATRAYHTHRFLRPKLVQMTRLDRFKYVSRKVVRWYGGGFILLGFFTALVVAAMVSLWLLGGMVVAATVIALTLRIYPSGPAGVLSQIVAAYAATQWGVVLAMSGRTRTTWAPAQSR